jgi:signal transduction histidine kinase
MQRRKAIVFSIIFSFCLISIVITLNVGWVLLNLRQAAFLILGAILFALIITGLILNTMFLIREIRRNELQDAFLNAVTHELKTPITSIKLYLETLKDRKVPEEKRREFYDIMLSDSNRLLKTVDQILQAARVRESRNNVEEVSFDLIEVIFEAIQTTRNRYNLPEGSLKLTSAEKIMISGNREEFLTVFLNLFDNAVKYCVESPKISIRVKDSSKKVDILIKDNGIGIDSAELRHVFKRFYRAMNAPKHDRRGTGLGLFIVKTIVEKHGGEVWAESRGIGKGSTFVVRLPKSLSKTQQHVFKRITKSGNNLAANLSEVIKKIKQKLMRV